MRATQRRDVRRVNDSSADAALLGCPDKPGNDD
jgi:hypothetical protein